MSKIFELFGYRLDKWNKAAECNLSMAWCPFMNAVCAGGGNRFQSAVDLRKNSALQKRIIGRDIVQTGICSILLNKERQPWIICPRRLLALKGSDLSDKQLYTRLKISEYADLSRNNTYYVWPEVKIKAVSSDNEESKLIDYTFDYIIAPVRPQKLMEAAKIVNLTISNVKKLAIKNGYTVISLNSEEWIADFPADPVLIIEIMTSSTSGGNKDKRTQISMAFEDAILKGDCHNGPGINYRQVWARMTSQLIAKSQIGLAWGGRTIWVIQDVLADYISKSTGLLLSQYISNQLNQVNILSFGYGESIFSSDAIIELKSSELYSGQITNSEDIFTRQGFIDIVKTGCPPPKAQIWKSLLSKHFAIWQW